MQSKEKSQIPYILVWITDSVAWPMAPCTSVTLHLLNMLDVVLLFPPVLSMQELKRSRCMQACTVARAWFHALVITTISDHIACTNDRMETTHAGETKIAQRADACTRVKEEVSRLHVAMDYPARVDVA